MNPAGIDQSGEDYCRNRRISLSKFFRKGAYRVLDVGCGAGTFGAYLKRNDYATEVIGIEINPKAVEEAFSNLDHVYRADLNHTKVAQLLSECNIKPFDYIVCADVLEHLVDPWQVLHDLSAYLSPSGQLIASIPNVRHWSVWLPLILGGKWTYQDSGIMDRTHLRFFTKSTIFSLFRSSGLAVVRLHPLIGGNWRLVDKYSLHLLQEFLAIQWVFVAVRKSEG